jgi:hypothetical protein
MNPRYFGDSYDIVKRFFCAELATLGYAVLAQPMLTGEWSGAEAAFLRFIGASALHESPQASSRTALFFDPDTGVHQKPSPKHISLAQVAAAAAQHVLAFAFDQSFSRQQDCSAAMRSKLAVLRELGCHALYYDSHARFLFASKAGQPIAELREHLLSLGLPASRLVAHGA